MATAETVAVDTAQILVVDDEPEMCETCRKILTRQGHEIWLAENGEEGLRRLREQHIDLAILDLRLPDMDGLEVLRRAKTINPDIIAIMISAHGTVETAIEAVREGAFDYLLKPFSMAELEVTTQRSLNHRRLVEQNRELQDELRCIKPFTDIVASSPQMQKVLETIRKVATSDANILLRGESGTGKELAARAIHTASRRSHRPFVPIDCAAMPENLLESEMFGHEKGAFTGAASTKRGLLETAADGTVFMDEIGELPLTMQSKLLRVLQDHQFRRVGGTELLKTDFRLIAATNRDLPAMVRDGSFREDLYYRLNVVTVELPPLRDRRSDIVPLAQHFLVHFAEKNRKDVMISNAAMMILEKYLWPGNVRELMNAVERAVSLTEFNQITPLDLPRNILESVKGEVRHSDQSFRDAKNRAIEEFEPRYLSQVLSETSGNVSEAARRSGMQRSAFQRLMAKYGLQRLNSGGSPT
jgi:DNA-binding NtrC family response regulator